MTIESNLTIRDFCPWNTWIEDKEEENLDIEAQFGINFFQKKDDGTFQFSEKIFDGFVHLNGKKIYVIDTTTGNRFLDGEHGMREKNMALLLVEIFFGILLHVFFKRKISPLYRAGITIGLFAMPQLFSTLIKTAKIITFYHFWTELADEKQYHFKARLVEAAKDLLKIVATPIVIVGQKLTAIYGIFRPRDAFKLQVNTERIFYDKSIMENASLVDLFNDPFLSFAKHPLKFLVKSGNNPKECLEIQHKILKSFPLFKGPKSA